MSINSIINKAERDFSRLQNTGAINSVSPTYELINQNFTAEIGKNYAIDTTIGSISVTLPANPQTGDVIGFADARGTWATNPIVILRNGGLIEGSGINFSNNAAGTFFVVLFIDSSTGWRVLASGAKPLNLVLPTVSGTYEFASTNGTWTGSPTSFSYQWQMSTNGISEWVNINGATSSSYTGIQADEGKYVRVSVVATNSNGPSIVVYSAASNAINLPDFPTSDLLAFWKLDNVNDSSGNNNTLTNTNSVTFSLGKIGNAAVFNNTNYLSTSGSVTWSTNWSISFWFIVNNATVNNLDTVFDSCTNPGGPVIDLSGGSARYNNGAVVIGSVAYIDNEWNHVVIRKFGSSTQLHMNNVASTVWSWPSSTHISPVKLGSSIGSGGRFFDGKLDAVGIWNRSLTTEEITQLYNNGNGVEPA